MIIIFHFPILRAGRFLPLLSCLILVPAGARAQVDDQVVERHVVILSAYKSFDAARQDAEKIARASKVPFSMEGRIYDKKRGIIYPDDFEDEVFAGAYISRRFDTTCLPGSDKETAYLSIEKSDDYQGFKPGFYIVVAGIKETRDEGLRQVARFKTWAPTGYVKKTRIYVGCMH